MLLVVVIVADRFGAMPLFYATGAVAAIVSVAWLVGALLPKEAIGSIVVRAAEFLQSPEVVWQSLIDYEAFPTWRRDLRSVTPIAAHGTNPPERLASRVDKPNGELGRGSEEEMNSGHEGEAAVGSQDCLAADPLSGGDINRAPAREVP